MGGSFVAAENSQKGQIPGKVNAIDTRARRDILPDNSFGMGGRGEKGESKKAEDLVCSSARMAEQLGWWTGARGRFAIITLRYPDLGWIGGG